MKNNKKMSKGITLIALVVTIIVLLILAGISIMMLTGDNGILNRSGDAKEKTGENQIIEEARIDILSTFTTNKSDTLSEKELRDILDPKFGTVSTTKGKSIKEETLTTKDGKYSILVSKIYNGTFRQPLISEVDPKVYYGQAIDYDVDLGKYVDGKTDLDLDGKPQYDWKIFYNDGTNIYIIAEDYVAMSNSLIPPITGRATNNNNPYSLYWPNIGNNMRDNGKTGSDDIFGAGASSKTLVLANKFLADWKTKVTGSNKAVTYPSAKMVASLMDTNIWRNFAASTKISGLTSKAEELSAISGPTLEMWVASWNKKHGLESDDANKLQLYIASNAEGYFVGKSENPDADTNPSYASNQAGTTGYEDQLYYPHTSTLNMCVGYWLASPSAYGIYYAMYVYCNGSVGHVGFYNAGQGVRPVVCLPSDITASWNKTDEVWNIIKK